MEEYCVKTIGEFNLYQKIVKFSIGMTSDLAITSEQNFLHLKRRAYSLYVASNGHNCYGIVVSAQ